MGDIDYVPDEIRRHLLSWDDIGRFFADLLASRTLDGIGRETATNHLIEWKERFATLAGSCEAAADHRAEAATLLKLENRWIQVYNSRPDSGHWERGEGQFDSIDGRLMFTLDEIAFLPEAERPDGFEFWLPQMVSSHPWISEQRDRGYGSKRLRNILVELAPSCSTKFADQLDDSDWSLLRENPQMLLERRDWQPDTHSIADVVNGGSTRDIANAGISNLPQQLRRRIATLLEDHSLYYCALRGYTPDWSSLLRSQISRLPAGSTVLAPRLPSRLTSRVSIPQSITLVPAEECTKEHLLMLRQLHRYAF